MTEEQIKILDIPFTALRQEEIMEKLHQTLLKKGEKLFLATPNPEMLLASLKSPDFQKVLQSADLNLPDGNGLIWAKKYLDQTVHLNNKALIILKGISSLISFLWHPKNDLERFNQAIHGSDLTIAILKDPQLSKDGIYLLGNKHGLHPETAKLTAKTLQKQHPQLNLSGYSDSDSTDKSLVEKINQSQATILLVGFGAPAQEKWLHENLSKLTHIKIAMGIGGTFDFIAGILPRAPQWMRKAGLEWLYRLYKQPKRIKRIFNATIVFPYQIIKHRIKNKTI